MPRHRGPVLVDTNAILECFRVGSRRALSGGDAWVPCGPDKASLRFGIRLGLEDRLVALEALLDDAGHRPNETLRPAYTTKWLKTTLGDLFFSEGPKRP